MTIILSLDLNYLHTPPACPHFVFLGCVLHGWTRTLAEEFCQSTGPLAQIASCVGCVQQCVGSGAALSGVKCRCKRFHLPTYLPTYLPACLPALPTTRLYCSTPVSTDQSGPWQPPASNWLWPRNAVTTPAGEAIHPLSWLSIAKAFRVGYTD